ncbi:MAG: serine/threonine kinase PknH [Solirubrobacteraceae bacterium]|jgi:serine/threonine-protein kinase|nr:serine/threonine kinase PknH [Solirubrobacteraceae bacterium]
MTTPPAPDPRLGTRVGEYHIVSLLGVGGMGSVYLAQDPEGNRVALKLVRADYANDAVFRKRFAREARIAQTVEHPKVVAVVATGEHEGVPYMAQRFVDGLTVDQKHKQDGDFTPVEAVRVCEDVAAGLEALWQAGMVHRDVKPANILLDAHGTAYVTDFGLAKDSQGSLLTLPGQALGSMDYMAPEQIRGEDVSAASDIYALGCVMFEITCGRAPFAHVQGMRILWAHLQDPPPDPLSLKPDMPPRFAQAMLTALQKEPENRPARATDYARALRASIES